MTTIGVPVFQAIRPLSHSLSVSQGKGLTPIAAQVGALLEAVEFDAAERLAPIGPARCLRDMDEGTRRIWSSTHKRSGGITLDPLVKRQWLPGTVVGSDAPCLIPWDLLSLDFTRAGSSDIVAASSGLACGNTPAEAVASALAEVIERHASFRLDHSSPAERRAVELDCASVTHPVIQALLARFAACGHAVRVWASGLPMGIAAFDCVLGSRSGSSLPPVGGSGCHPDRTVALLRALLEAVQSLTTLLAGARDDLTGEDYGKGDERWFGILFGALSFGPGPVHWKEIPDQRDLTPRQRVALLHDVALRQSPAPVLLFEHDPPAPGLSLVHAVAPGLSDLGRTGRPSSPCPAPARIRQARGRRLVIFSGPSLRYDDIDPMIERHPPACCGDLARLLDDPPAAVGLIDGCFEVAPTVWHKEIIDLIAAGTTVYGAASIGALRAAELGDHGMIGIGVIHALYQAGWIARDDAVMLSHAPAELDDRPLTVALVDAEYALLCIALDPSERRMLQRIVRTTHYADRTWPACLAAYARRTGRAASMTPRAMEIMPSLKRADALLLLRVLNGHRRVENPAARSRPPLTCFYNAMIAECR